ncbi:unnamed protein product [Lampetra planeri]
MEVWEYPAMLMVWCMIVGSEPRCDPTEFLHSNGSCVECLVCGPGEQLSEDCGFGDGGRAVCVPCEERTFSTGTDVDPCRRCTQCNLLNRLEDKACTSSSDAVCGQCLPGYYELKSITGKKELPCVPCHNGDNVHKYCLHLTAHRTKADVAVTVHMGKFKAPEEKRIKKDTHSMILIGSATASLIFLFALLLWAFLLTVERFKQVLDHCPGPERLMSGPEHLEHPPQSSSTDLSTPSRCYENEVHPTSIVINVTTNVKPSNEKNSHISLEEQQSNFSSMEEMERKLQKIWEIAQGKGIEMLDYDSVQDLSLLLDSADNRNLLLRLGRSLGVPPQVITHLQGFQDLFQYLCTSTYTLLPQLAQAAALLPKPEVVARIHRAVVTN